LHFGHSTTGRRENIVQGFTRPLSPRVQHSRIEPNIDIFIEHQDATGKADQGQFQASRQA
jgi:hypothetical protein